MHYFINGASVRSGGYAAVLLDSTFAVKPLVKVNASLCCTFCSSYQESPTEGDVRLQCTWFTGREAEYQSSVWTNGVWLCVYGDELFKAAFESNPWLLHWLTPKPPGAVVLPTDALKVAQS